ncbi:MAG: class I SAM-dependent rRNA methyltransferase, partial [Alphaproteobacteria bacterium]|nr:class I SAM-dependent rRNA methyltransferase [Alphaproteobacteria bacterium]
LGGQKTGWFFDLAEARGHVAALAADARVLDVYCHAGAFAIRAAVAGARQVIAVDRSEAALALARESAALSGVAERVRFLAADAFSELERRGGSGERHDIVILDPPSFVKSRKDLAAGIKGYRKLARLGAPLVADGGFLFIASCSHHVAPQDFAAEVAHGLHLAGRTGRLLRAGGAGPDHPVHLMLPESAYIKWQLLQVDDPASR